MRSSHRGNHVAKLGVSPWRLPLVGNAWHLLVHPLTFLRQQRELGDIVEFRHGNRRVYFVNDPVLAHEVLTGQRANFPKGGPVINAARALGRNGLSTTTDESLHHRQRRLMQPLFHHSRFPAYIAAMRETVEEITSSWREGEKVRIDSVAYQISSAVLSRCLFSGKLGSNATRDFMTLYPSVVGGIGRRATLPMPWLHRLPTAANRRYTRDLATIHRVTDQLIADHAAGDETYDDILSALLEARDDDTGKTMSESQVHDEVVTLISAASETTAQTLSWALRVLAKDTELDRRVAAELQGVLANRAPRHQDLQELPLLSAVVSETLRLYPPLWLVSRYVPNETELGGVLLRAGSEVYISAFANHHDAELFPSPEVFDVTRWLPGAPTPGRGAYIPFGMGTRKCIGNEFALAELMTTLAIFLQRWRLSPQHGGRLSKPKVAFTYGTGPFTLVASQRRSGPPEH